MEPSFVLLLRILAAGVLLDAVVLAVIIVQKSRARGVWKRRSTVQRALNRAILAADTGGLTRLLALNPIQGLGHLRHLRQLATPNQASRETIAQALSSFGLRRHAMRLMASPMIRMRIQGYLALGMSPDPGAQGELVEALLHERRVLARLVILGTIAGMPSTPDPARLVAGLARGIAGLRQREVAVLTPLAPKLRGFFRDEAAPEDDLLLRLYLLTAREVPEEGDWAKLERIATGRKDALADEAAAILAERFPAARFLEAFADRRERRFTGPYLRLLGANLTPMRLEELDPWFEIPELREKAVAAAASVLAYHPGSEELYLGLIRGESSQRGRCLSRAIGHRLTSILYHAALPLDDGIRAMVRDLIDEGQSGVILETLSSTLSPATRDAFLDLLAEFVTTRPESGGFIARHVDAETAARIGAKPPPPEPDRPHIPFSNADKAFLASLVAVGILLYPAIFAALHASQLGWMSPSELLYRFIFDFQWLFAYYTLAINFIYFLLLALSMAKISAQAVGWESEILPLLAARGIFPPISIIVPAYNEGTSIVENVQSLLALDYPSFEVIVVNDGSKDNTVHVLTKAFDLEPAAAGGSGSIATMPARSLYRSAAIPNLRLLDKSNGGKADAINAGLNLATGDFVCTIDADSILDNQALVRAMFQVVASDRKIIAIGGNVFPVNGCVVEHGHLQDIKIPNNPLARFQTVEYLRSFVAGRLGWTTLNSLLIISGAFGLFRRQAVMELGGYLTGQGAGRNETVGEDMEMVVRLTRNEREAGRAGKVEYAYNANCWTEVPEEGRLLRRQRDRWQRGLMEVLAFHRGMTFRPKYGATGSIALPYFYLFELVGPWLETIGYSVLAAAIVLNLLDPVVPLAVFGISVVFGILISVASMLFAERQILYFKTKEFPKLLLIAIIENFGYRQVTSMGRVVSNAQFFFIRRGWGAQERKGFARETPAE